METPGRELPQEARRIKKALRGPHGYESFVPVSQGGLELNKDTLLCLATEKVI